MLRVKQFLLDDTTPLMQNVGNCSPNDGVRLIFQ
jgi:hypothetical protein